MQGYSLVTRLILSVLTRIGFHGFNVYTTHNNSMSPTISNLSRYHLISSINYTKLTVPLTISTYPNFQKSHCFEFLNSQFFQNNHSSHFSLYKNYQNILNTHSHTHGSHTTLTHTLSRSISLFL